jgi:hypothetical protein
LALAFIFGDEDCMEQMMARLDSYPLFDLPLVREHLRITFNGFAALLMGRRKKNNAYTALGHTIMKKVRKLDRIGSVNAHPVYLCLCALDKNKKEAYAKAIAFCASARLIHLEAMMSEHCGLMLFEKNKKDEAREYLGKAMWLYDDWGALAKVKQLKWRFVFLGDFPRRSEGEMPLSIVLRKATRFGIAGDSPTGTVEQGFHERMSTNTMATAASSKYLGSKARLSVSREDRISHT